MGRTLHVFSAGMYSHSSSPSNRKTLSVASQYTIVPTNDTVGGGDASGANSDHPLRVESKAHVVTSGAPSPSVVLAVRSRMLRSPTGSYVVGTKYTGPGKALEGPRS